jgi:hypothetical protein
MPARAPPATKNATRADGESAHRQSRSQELYRCIKIPFVQPRSHPRASTPSTSTGTTATAAAFIPGNSCGENARARTAGSRHSAVSNRPLSQKLSAVSEWERREFFNRLNKTFCLRRLGIHCGRGKVGVASNHRYQFALHPYSHNRISMMLFLGLAINIGIRGLRESPGRPEKGRVIAFRAKC